VAAPNLAHEVDSRSVSPAGWCGRAYGVDVDSNRSLSSVGGRDGAALARSLELRFETPQAVKAAFPRGAHVLVERAPVLGRPKIRVEMDRELGYNIWAPGFGRYIVSADGTRIRGAIPDRAGIRWERLLLAQPLPLAAALQGLELFHASAVRVDAGVVAFVASSGTGKTSAAAHLVSGGAELVTDDILAVEPTTDGVVAHAGGTLLHLSDSETAAIDTGRQDDRLFVLDERLDKRQLGAQISTEPGRLAGLYFLERSRRFDRLVIGRISPPSPKLLLSGAFLTYLQLPERLLRQLELCAAVAATVPTFSVGVPADFGAARLALAIRDHTDSHL
jgi:hypothetical protein